MHEPVPVKLFSRAYGGTGHPPLVILHGLLGSSRNWQTAARLLTERYEVHALDLRNHGQSPHAEDMSYAAQATDVCAWIDGLGRGPVTLLGHSMGGKVAMRVACGFPNVVARLVVADIAVHAYPPRWEREFAAMRALDLDALGSRGAAEQALEASISDWAFRKFLCTNLDRDPEGRLRWSVNLDRLQASLPELFRKSIAEDAVFDAPCRFLRGERSRFVVDEDWPEIQRHFPRADLVTIPGAGHNVHFDAPQVFSEAL